MSDGLKLDPASINISDIHRLPQHSIYKNGKKITRPIIVKPSSVFDKQSIFKAVKNLKNFNQNFYSKDYITEYLPAEFMKQKQALLSQFKEGRQNNKKTKWRIVCDEYCLFVNETKVCAS